MTRERWRLVLSALARGIDDVETELDAEQNSDRWRHVADVPEEVRARWAVQEAEIRELRAAFGLLWERYRA